MATHIQSTYNSINQSTHTSINNLQISAVLVALLAEGGKNMSGWEISSLGRDWKRSFYFLGGLAFSSFVTDIENKQGMKSKVADHIIQLTKQLVSVASCRLAL
jgi:hypothetical protein